MTIAPAEKHWTDKELLAMPHDGCKRQVVGGELITLSPAGFDHGNVIFRLGIDLGNFVFERKLGEFGDGQTGFRLRTGDLFCPHISFVTAARVETQRRKKTAFFQGAPDLFVEVLSPSDTVEVLDEKLRQFFAEGTRLAWVVHPRRQCASVYRAPDDFRILKSRDTLDGEDVIPGFKLPVRKIFR